MKYKVLEGAHKQGGKTYNKGEVVDTTMDLVALFPNKFVVVGESEDLPPAGGETQEPKSDSEFPPFAPAPAAPAPKPPAPVKPTTKKGK